MILSEQQQNVIDEYIIRQKNPEFTGTVLSLPMGSGKTLISLEISKIQKYRKVLIICSKTLVSSWNFEIQKIYNRSIKYEIFHPDYISKKKLENWKPLMDTQFVITTPEIIKKSYTPTINALFINNVPLPRDVHHFTHNLEYTYPNNPFGNNPISTEYFHSVKWDCIIIDECQNYTNIEAQTPKSICSLCSKYRILLSGTIFQEINLKRVMGFFLLLNLKFPRSTYDCHTLITSSTFGGINKYCIVRNSNPEFKDVILNTKIICHDLDKYEAICFSLLKQIISDLYYEYVNEKNKYLQNVTLIKKLGGSLLAMIVYLRQTLVVPRLAIGNLLLKISNDVDDLNIVKNMMEKIIDKYGLTEWINEENKFLNLSHNTFIDNNIPENINNDVSENLNNDFSENINNDISENINNDVSENLNNNIYENENVNNNVSENLNNKISTYYFSKENSPIVNPSHLDLSQKKYDNIITNKNNIFWNTSTRIKHCINILIEHENEVTVVYSNFLMCLNYLKNKYEELYGNNNTFIISSEMTIKKREHVFCDFNKCEKGVLFLTYNMGAEGLNLQHAKNVIQLDMYWNRCKEDQAITRVFRNGQLSPDVNQYILISNTSLEKNILNKQCDKLSLIKQLKMGSVKNFDVTKMKIKDIVVILKNETNYILANTIKNFNLN